MPEPDLPASVPSSTGMSDTAPSSVSTREAGGTGRDRTYLCCGCVVAHRRQLHILNLNVTALERRPVYSCSSRVRGGHGYELSTLQDLGLGTKPGWSVERASADPYLVQEQQEAAAWM